MGFLPKLALAMTCEGLFLSNGQNGSLTIVFDTTEAAKEKLVEIYKEDPVKSLEKNWKRVSKKNEGTLVVRIFKATDGTEVRVVYDTTSSASTNDSIIKVPANRFVFAIDMLDQDGSPGNPAVYIMTRKFWEENGYLADYLSGKDAKILNPVLEALNIGRLQDSIYGLTFSGTKEELKTLLIKHGFVFDMELQTSSDNNFN